MPVQRVARKGIYDTIDTLEREGNIVGSVISDGPDHFLVFTQRPTLIEYRTSGGAA
jgi:hypothetical protein